MYTSQIFPIVKSLGFIGLSVPDLPLAAEEAQEIGGLRQVFEERGVRFFSSNDRKLELILSQATSAALDNIGLEAVDESSFDLLKSRLSGGNVQFDEILEPHPGVTKSVRFRLPSGHRMEVHTSTGELTQTFNETPGARPQRLGHALLKVEKLKPVEEFLCEILSFRISDRALDGKIAWLRCSEVHHSINLLQGPAGIHHYAWEVDDWAVFKRLGDILRGDGRRFVWGPGRHGPGNNLFTYHADSTGTLVEYFADVQHIENEDSYQWRDWSGVPEWYNVWGPLPPENFIEYGIPVQA
jgi:catechol 2,3-dioxygenase-like lactoylglutathione lyase family enzyme